MSQVVLDADAVQRIIPHRPPFLLVDCIVELEAGRRIVGTRSVRADDPWFAGHFPTYPVMPGVLLVEALAQTAAVLMLHDVEKETAYPLFAGIDAARFRRPVRPGDELRLELTVRQQRSNSCKLDGTATVQGDTAAQAQIFAVLHEPD